MLDLFKKSYGIYKENFKLLFILSLFNSLFDILDNFLFLYKNNNYIKILNSISSLLSIVISDIIFIMIIYAISSRHSKIALSSLFIKVKERFWKLVVAGIRILLFGLLYFLLFILLYGFLKIIIRYELPLNYTTAITGIITIITIYLEAQFIFALLAAILEDINTKPFEWNTKLVQGNFKNLSVFALFTAVSYIPLIIIHIYLPNASLFKFGMQFIAQLLICAFYPFICAYGVTIYEEAINKIKKPLEANI